MTHWDVARYFMLGTVLGFALFLTVIATTIAAGLVNFYFG